MRGRRTAVLLAALLGAIGLFVAGCTSHDRPSPTPTSTGPNSSPAPSSSAPGTARWAAVWAAAPVPGYTDSACPRSTGRTVRNIVHLSAGGDTVRIRLSNRGGTAPLRIPAVSVGEVESGAALRSGSSHRLHFAGQSAVTIPAGREVASDALRLTVHATQDLAVSVYVPTQTGRADVHPRAFQTNYLSGPGDHTGNPSAHTFPEKASCWTAVDGVDVSTSSRLTGTVVAFGDSLTDGFASTPSADRRYPDELAARLRAAGSTLAVVNAGLSGNQLLIDGHRSGLSGVHRFAADALDQPGVRAVIVQLGTNDIGLTEGGHADPPATVSSLTAGFAALAEQARTRHIPVYFSPITPFLTVPAHRTGYHTLAGEQLRDGVNRWLTAAGPGDGLIDFAAALADPADPRRLAATYDSGDHIHPGDAGYARMAAVVPMRLLDR